MLELAAELIRCVKYWNGSETFDLMTNWMLFICRSLEKFRQRKI